MKYVHEIDHNKKIIFRSFSDTLTAEDIEESWYAVLRMSEFVEDNYDLISDYRNVKLKISFSYMRYVFSFYKNNKDKLRGSSHAVIVDSPRPSAFSTYFERKAGSLMTMPYATFSDFGQALEWLNKN